MKWRHPLVNVRTKELPVCTRGSRRMNAATPRAAGRCSSRVAQRIIADFAGKPRRRPEPGREQALLAPPPPIVSTMESVGVSPSWNRRSSRARGRGLHIAADVADHAQPASLEDRFIQHGAASPALGPATGIDVRPPRIVTESAAAAAASRNVSRSVRLHQNSIGKRAVKDVAGRGRVDRLAPEKRETAGFLSAVAVKDPLLAARDDDRLSIAPMQRGNRLGLILGRTPDRQPDQLAGETLGTDQIVDSFGQFARALAKRAGVENGLRRWETTPSLAATRPARGRRTATLAAMASWKSPAQPQGTSLPAALRLMMVRLPFARLTKMTDTGVRSRGIALDQASMSAPTAANSSTMRSP